MPPIAREVSGPTTAMTNSRQGVLASASISVNPPRKCRLIWLTGIWNDRAARAWEISWRSTDAYRRIAKTTPAT